MHSIPGRRVILILFLVFLLLPIYWLVNMSFKTNYEIISTMTLWPHQPLLARAVPCRSCSQLDVERLEGDPQRRHGSGHNPYRGFRRRLRSGDRQCAVEQ